MNAGALSSTMRRDSSTPSKRSSSRIISSSVIHAFRPPLVFLDERSGAVLRAEGEEDFVLEELSVRVVVHLVLDAHVAERRDEPCFLFQFPRGGVGEDLAPAHLPRHESVIPEEGLLPPLLHEVLAHAAHGAHGDDERGDLRLTLKLRGIRIHAVREFFAGNGERIGAVRRLLDELELEEPLQVERKLVGRELPDVELREARMRDEEEIPKDRGLDGVEVCSNHAAIVQASGPGIK